MNIYADYASITPTDPKVLEEYGHACRTYPGNPSSSHRIGVEAKLALNMARTVCAELIHARSEDVVFTGSATEANNLAIIGLVEGLYNKGQTYVGMHIIVSEIEHSSVLESAKLLELRGVRVSYAPVRESGIIDPEVLKTMVTRQTVLVSVMMVNNEIGTIQPIRELGKIIRAEEKLRNQAKADGLCEGILPIIFHTDASQAFLYQEIDVRKLGVDMLTLDSHKIYGPRGAGLLWLTKGVDLAPIIVGGGQERGLRSGTEAVPTIVALAYALRLADQLRSSETKRLTNLRKFFISELLVKIPGTIIHGHDASITSLGDACAPHIVNFTLINIDHEYLAFALDAKGIAISTRSACMKDEDQSYVLKAIKQDYGSLRVSFGRSTTKGQIRTILRTIVSLYHSQSVQESKVSVKIG